MNAERRRLTSALRVTALLALALALGAVRTSASHGSWEELRYLPDPRYQHCALAVGDTLYVIGGSDAGGRPLDSGYWFLAQPGLWILIAPMPGGPRAEVSCVAVGTDIYVMGGRNAPWPAAPLTRVEKFDTLTGTWEARADMGAARALAAAASVRVALALDAGSLGGPRIYVAGGFGASGQVEASHEVYDVATDEWLPRSPLPGPRQAMSAAVVQGKIYYAGGWGANPEATHWKYDPAIDSFQTMAPLPAPRFGHVAALGLDSPGALASYLVLAGNAGGTLRYIVPEDVWEGEAPASLLLHAGAARILGKGHVYVHLIGGSGTSGISSTHERYTFY